MMAIFPKAVKIKFKKQVPYTAPDELIEAVIEKASEFYYASKSDTYVNYIDDYTIERYFVNQAAADEWAEFIKNEANKNNFEISDIEIFDV